jgi:hypothetical protein
MVTAMLCVEKYLADTKLYDLWQVIATLNIMIRNQRLKKQRAPDYDWSPHASSPRARTGSVIADSLLFLVILAISRNLSAISQIIRANTG